MLGKSKLARRTAFIYGAVALSWILFTDVLVFLGQSESQVRLVSAEMLKGVLFVVVTTMGLYLLLRYELQRRQRVEAQLEYQSNILSNVSDAIIAVDFDYRIQSWNPGAEAMYGWRAEEALGKLLSELLKPNYFAVTREQVLAEFKERGRWRGEVIQHRRDGTPLHIVANSSYLKDSDGKTIGMVSVNRDVTHQKRLESEIVEKENLFVALEHERNLQEIRTQSMRMASHEVRTPLTIIQSAAEMLITYGDRMTALERQTRLDNIIEQVEHMRDLLSEVSLLLNTDSAQPNFAPTEVDLVPYCESHLTEITRNLIDGYTIQRRVDSRGARLKIDPKLMRHVINNLVFNAVKYSPKGSSITVILEDDAEHVVLKVADRGIGIPEADLPHIFKPFYRASNVDKAPGTGLGLAIVKQIIDLHEGEIDVESRVGEGTTFTVKLPRNIEAAA